MFPRPSLLGSGTQRGLSQSNVPTEAQSEPLHEGSGWGQNTAGSYGEAARRPAQGTGSHLVHSRSLIVPKNRASVVLEPTLAGQQNTLEEGQVKQAHVHTNVHACTDNTDTRTSAGKALDSQGLMWQDLQETRDTNAPKSGCFPKGLRGRKASSGDARSLPSGSCCGKRQGGETGSLAAPCMPAPRARGSEPSRCSSAPR